LGSGREGVYSGAGDRLPCRTGIGQVLGIVACTATAICFEYFFEWTWFAAIPVGVLHYFVSSLLARIMHDARRFCTTVEQARAGDPTR
jgi:Kef-type K+ transport system membrane component KefB